MSKTRVDSTDMFTVVEPMNDHGATTVRSTATYATYHLVDYADESTRRAVSSLAAGDSARLSLSRVADRGNVWRAEAATPRASDAPDGLTAGE